MRAYARDLGIQPSKLSEILRGLCGLSAKSAMRIAKRLQLSGSESEYFVTAVRLQHERSKVARAQAQTKLARLTTNFGFNEIHLDRFRVISDWYHIAILELTDLADFESHHAWIAGRLGIPSKVAQEAITRLLDFGLLKQDEHGRLLQTHEQMATPNGIPSREIREHHSQILMKADEAQTSAPIEEREYAAITMAIDSSRLTEARAELIRFRREFTKDIQQGSNKDRVYCLAMQFFPLDKKRNK
jgi:uncharacterized protein (TIGR02147 family)